MLQQVDDGGEVPVDPIDIEPTVPDDIDPSETADADEGGSGYDDFEHPDAHPTPDNMWEFGLHCDTLCSSYTIIASFLLFVHLYIMAAPLEGWAGGNVLLAGNTVMTLIQYGASMAMAYDSDPYYQLDKRVRTTAFILALISFVGWAATGFSEIYRARNIDGDTIWDTNYEIMMNYMIVMDIPEAFLSLGTLFYAFRSGEFSPTGHNPHEDYYNDDRENPYTPS